MTDPDEVELDSDSSEEAPDLVDTCDSESEKESHHTRWSFIPMVKRRRVVYKNFERPYHHDTRLAVIPRLTKKQTEVSPQDLMRHDAIASFDFTKTAIVIGTDLGYVRQFAPSSLKRKVFNTLEYPRGDLELNGPVKAIKQYGNTSWLMLAGNNIWRYDQDVGKAIQVFHNESGSSFMDLFHTSLGWFSVDTSGWLFILEDLQFKKITRMVKKATAVTCVDTQANRDASDGVLIALCCCEYVSVVRVTRSGLVLFKYTYEQLSEFPIRDIYCGLRLAASDDYLFVSPYGYSQNEHNECFVNAYKWKQLVEGFDHTPLFERKQLVLPRLFNDYMTVCKDGFTEYLIVIQDDNSIIVYDAQSLEIKYTIHARQFIRQAFIYWGYLFICHEYPERIYVRKLPEHTSVCLECYPTIKAKLYKPDRINYCPVNHKLICSHFLNIN